jgi:FG-GAP-like repeat/FlgD Ig-like domain
MSSYNKQLIYLIIVILPFVLNQSFAQEYEVQFINKSPLYATASLLQDYDDDGDLDIIISRRNSTNDKLPSSVEWLENDGTGQFPRNTLFEDLSFPVDVDMGDFDKDGEIDYIVSDRYVSISSGALTLFQKQNDGSYVKLFIEDSLRTDQSAVADFDKDGNLDVVAVGFNRPTVSIYWNDGALNFSKQEITDTVAQVELVEVDDIDNDGDEDIVYGGGGLDGFKILYNNGSGVFDSSQTLFLNNNQYSNSKRGLAITDLDNDGFKDILTFSGVGFGGLYFFDGSDNFNSSLIDIVGIDLGGDIVVADFDGNGLKDIIRQNMGADYLSIHYQESIMVFTNEFLELNWDNRGPGQMSVGDLDGDEDLDLVFPENGNVDGDLAWFENIEGSLYRHNIYNEIEAVRIPKIADIDDDGDLDIVVSAGDDGVKTEEDEIVWYENQGEIKFIEHRIDDNISFPADIELGDIDGDGGLDIIATAHDDSSLIWYKRNGPGWFKIVVDENLVQPLGCDVADIDSDNDLDIALCEYGENKILLYMNNGAGVFSRKVVESNLPEPRAIKIWDMDNDGDSDIIVTTTDTNNTLVLYLNDGEEVFTSSILAAGQKSLALEIGDWDGNDTPDIIVGFDKGTSLGSTNRDIAVFLNDGQASFIDSTLIVLSERTDVLRLVDVDKDSDLDIVFGSGSGGIFPLRLGLNINGTVETIKDITDRAVRVYGIDAADINEDGIIDIVASDQVNSTNNLLLLIGSIGTAISNNTNIKPNTFALYQNYPNPFNPSTNIRYEIIKSDKVTLAIFDLLGRKVRTLVDDIKQAGSYNVHWDGRSYAGTILPSGLYIMQIKSNSKQISRRMLLLK